MNIFKRGDLTICQMHYGKGSPSEWSGKMCLIIDCLSDDPFLGNPDSEFFDLLKKSNEDYNISLARDVQYKVLVNHRILIMNHLCFIESDQILDWNMAFDEKALHY